MKNFLFTLIIAFCASTAHSTTLTMICVSSSDQPYDVSLSVENVGEATEQIVVVTTPAAPSDQYPTAVRYVGRGAGLSRVFTAGSLVWPLTSVPNTPQTQVAEAIVSLEPSGFRTDHSVNLNFVSTLGTTVRAGCRPSTD